MDNLNFAVARRYFDRRRQWTSTRLDMTNDLIERMLGHRTRLVQEEPAQWHQAEDQMLEHYLTQSTAMDGYAVAQTVMARGWLVVGLCGLAPAFISGNPSPERIA